MSDYRKIYADNKPFFDSLYEAIKNNEADKIAVALEQHPDFIAVPIRGGGVFDAGLLHRAADDGHIESCSVLIQKGIDINTPDNAYRTALHYAAKNGHLELVKWLVTNGAWVNGDSRCYTTPLLATADSTFGSVARLATRNPDIHFEIAKHLIEHGADVNRPDAKLNRTALNLAKEEKIAALIKLHGGLKVHETIDPIVERAGGILSHISTEVGYPLSMKISKGSVDIRTSLIDKGKVYKLLFTIGMFEKIPRMELMMCTRNNWVVNKQLAEENNIYSFPVCLMQCLADYRLAGGELTEGFIAEKCDERWNHLVWPNNLDAFIAVDYAFNQNQAESVETEISDDTVTLLLLVPIKYPKSGVPKGNKFTGWIEKRRIAKWAKNAFASDYL